MVYNLERHKNTFMRALESSPVHCAKSWPSWKWHNLGNAGMVEILHKCWPELSAVFEFIITNHLSMSSMIAFTRASPCSSYRYSFTDITKWSLKVPLMTWWSKSGVRSSWISAQANPCVQGFKGGQIKLDYLWYRLTTISALHLQIYEL